MKKKIGILTLPISENYGGILQCYALQEEIRNTGLIPCVLTLGKRNKSLIKDIVKYLLSYFPLYDFNNYKSTRRRKILLKDFIDKHITKTNPIRGDRQITKFVSSNNLNAIVVGSDQVWRYKYTEEFYPNFFINFHTHNKCKKIAYGASFGLPNWSHHELNKDISKYLKNFDAISVREIDGLKICSDNFNYNDAKHVCDPVLLHSKEKYEELCKDVAKTSRSISIYALDQKQKANQTARNLAKALNINDKHITYFGHKKNPNEQDNTIEEWLAYFRDSDFIITDSFHGMMFSIIFRKSFIVLANKSRGISRFNSVLSMLDLESRLLYSSNLSYIELNIDYTLLEEKINNFKKESKSFLKEALEI